MLEGEIPIQTPEEKILKLKIQNSARQRVFYSKNAEKIKEMRRLKYKNEHILSSLENICNSCENILSKLSETERKQYSNHLKTIFSILDTANENIVNFILKHANKVIKLITAATHGSDFKRYTVNSRKAFIQCILKIITVLKLPITATQLQIYKNAFETLKLDSIDANIKAFDTTEIFSFAEYLEKIKEKFGELSKEYVMSKLYEEVTVRDDFRLKVVPNFNDTVSEIENYIVVPIDSHHRLTIIINEYKTSSKYGPIREELSRPLSNLIREFIKHMGIRYGEYLFGRAKTNSNFVSKMNKQIGIDGGINNYRHMKASEIKYKDNKERAKLAMKMKHSPLVSLRYLRKLKNYIQ